MTKTTTESTTSSFFLTPTRFPTETEADSKFPPASVIQGEAENTADLAGESKGASDLQRNAEILDDMNQGHLSSAEGLFEETEECNQTDLERSQNDNLQQQPIIGDSGPIYSITDDLITAQSFRASLSIDKIQLAEHGNKDPCITDPQGTTISQETGATAEDPSSMPPTFLFNLSPSYPSEIENLDIEMFGDFPRILSPDVNSSGYNCGLEAASIDELISNDLNCNNRHEQSPDPMNVDDSNVSPTEMCPQKHVHLKSQSIKIISICPDSANDSGTRVLLILDCESDDTVNLEEIECDFGGLRVKGKFMKKNVIECFTPSQKGGCVPLCLTLRGNVISNLVNFQFKERYERSSKNTTQNNQSENWLERYGYSQSILSQKLSSYFEFLHKELSPEISESKTKECFDAKWNLSQQIINFMKNILTSCKVPAKSVPSFMAQSGVKLSLLQVFAALDMSKVIMHLLQWKKEENSALSMLSQEDLDPHLGGINGENALMWACYMGHLEVAMFLTCWDFNTLKSVDLQERGAIEIATLNGHDQIALLLQYWRDMIFLHKQSQFNQLLGTSDHPINSSLSSLSESHNAPGVSSSSSAVFSFSSSFDSCPSDKCLECSGSKCQHQSRKVEPLPKGPKLLEEQETMNRDNEKMPPPNNPLTESDNPLSCNQGGSSSGSESVETPTSKAERRRIIMRRLIKRLAEKSKAGQIDIPDRPVGASSTKDTEESEAKAETKQQGLKRQHEDRNSNHSSPLSPEQIKIQQHVVQLSQLQQQQLQHQKNLQQEPCQQSTSSPTNSKESEPNSKETEQSDTDTSLKHQLQALQQQVAAQQQHLREMEKQQHLIWQRQEMMNRPLESSQPSPIESPDKHDDCFVTPAIPKALPSLVRTSNLQKDPRTDPHAHFNHSSTKSGHNPNPLNLPDHLYALRDAEGNCYQNNSSDSNGEEASVYTLASQIIDALPRHIKQQGAPLPPFTTSADFRAKDISVSTERNLPDIPITTNMITPPPPPLCSQNVASSGWFPGDVLRHNLKTLPEVWRFGESQLEEDTFPEFGVNDGNYCFGTYRDVPGTPRSAYSSYSSSLSPASSLQSPVSFAPIEYEDLNPPSTAELNEFFTATSLDPNTPGLEEEDLSQLTLTDNEQRELYEAAKVLHSAYQKSGDCGITGSILVQSSREPVVSGPDSAKEIDAAVTIQKHFRTYKKFMQCRQRNDAAIRIQAQFRAYSEHKRFRASRKAAVVIQNQYRCYREHKNFLATRQAALVIQQRYKSHYRKRKQQQQQQLQQQQQNHVTQSGAGPTSTSMLAGYVKPSGIHHCHSHLSPLSLQHHSSPSITSGDPHLHHHHHHIQGSICSFPNPTSHHFHSHFPHDSTTQNILPSPNSVTTENPLPKILVQHQPSSQQQHYASSAQSTMAAATAAAAAAAQEKQHQQPNCNQESQEDINEFFNSVVQNNNELGESSEVPFSSLAEFDSLPDLPANESLFTDLY